MNYDRNFLLIRPLLRLRLSDGEAGRKKKITMDLLSIIIAVATVWATVVVLRDGRKSEEDVD